MLCVIGESMSYWFGYRVFDSSIDIRPGLGVLEGPFDSYATAKKEKERIRGGDMQKTSIFPASTKEEATEKMNKETWMV